MDDNGAWLSPDDRETLLRTARSRLTPHGLATRARLVVDCADHGVTEAARRSSVSRTTAAKWWQRYVDAGIDGLHDVARAGRPSIPGDVVRRVLTCTLDEPPSGSERWTTRAAAEAAGVSQATVSRIRRQHFPHSDADAVDLSLSIITYVDVHSSGCALGFHASSGASAPGAQARWARVDVVETILCAALLGRPPGGTRATANEASDAVDVLGRAARRLPGGSAVTLIIDSELDERARQWLSHHPEITACSVTGDGWLGLLHPVADSVDPRQLPELREVQRLIRLARSAAAEEFVWCRGTEPSWSSAPRTASDAQHEPPAGNLTHVVRGICTAIAEGELQAGDSISAQHIARRSHVTPGRVADTLAQLAEEALIDRQAGRYLLPVPTPRDVLETYTARGLLGTAIARRLAAVGACLPAVADEYFARLVRCDELGHVYEAGVLDLDLQDELAAAAAMPRIGSMFIRLTLQLRLFVTIFGLSYRYPTDEIVADDRRILAGIRSGDPERSAEAWRAKIDNCARFMLAHLRPLE